MAFKKARKKLEEAIKKARLKKAYKKEGMDKKAAKEKAAKKAKAPETGKVRRGVKGVESTKGGEYAKYGKKSKPAQSFREAFAKARKEKGAGKTFMWDGRSYSTNTADDVKKAKAAKKTVAPKKPAPKKLKPASKKDVKPKGKPDPNIGIGKQKKAKKDMKVTKAAIKESMTSPLNKTVKGAPKKAKKNPSKARRILNEVGDTLLKGAIPKFIEDVAKNPSEKLDTRKMVSRRQYEDGGQVESSSSDGGMFDWPSTDARKR